MAGSRTTTPGPARASVTSVVAEIGKLQTGWMPQHHAGRSEQQAVADGQAGLPAEELPNVHVQGVGARSCVGCLAHEGPVGAAQILDLQRRADAQQGVLARHGRIVDADRARLVAPDRHLSRGGEIERADLLAREDHQ